MSSCDGCDQKEHQLDVAKKEIATLKRRIGELEQPEGPNAPVLAAKQPKKTKDAELPSWDDLHKEN